MHRVTLIFSLEVKTDNGFTNGVKIKSQTIKMIIILLNELEATLDQTGSPPISLRRSTVYFHYFSLLEKTYTEFRSK